MNESRQPPFNATTLEHRLRRHLGFGNAFALQFALICVLGSLFANFTWGLTTTGPAFIWAWIIGGLLQLSVALSLAELSSAYPQAGGCYTWVRRLSSPALTWITGYLLLVGYVAALADNDFGAASAFLGFVGIANPGGGMLALIALACLFGQTLLGILSIQIAARSVVAAVTIQLLGAAIIIIGLMVVGLRQNPAILFHAVGTSEHEHTPPFLLMLMIPAWTITGMDATGNFADELKDPARMAPRGLISAALTAFACGIGLIVFPLLSMTDLARTTASSSSLSFILHTRLGNGVATVLDASAVSALIFLPVVVQLAAGRLLWVQARDGVWPASTWLARVSGRGVPARSILACAVGAAVLLLLWPALYGLGTVWPALWALAYAITIGVALSGKAKGLVQPGNWRFGKWGIANNTLAIIWSAFLTVLLLLFDAFHAVPLFIAILLVGLIVYSLWVKPQLLRQKPGAYREQS